MRGGGLTRHCLWREGIKAVVVGNGQMRAQGEPPDINECTAFMARQPSREGKLASIPLRRRPFLFSLFISFLIYLFIFIFISDSRPSSSSSSPA